MHILRNVDLCGDKQILQSASPPFTYTRPAKRSFFFDFLSKSRLKQNVDDFVKIESLAVLLLMTKA